MNKLYYIPIVIPSEDDPINPNSYTQKEPSPKLHTNQKLPAINSPKRFNYNSNSPRTKNETKKKTATNKNIRKIFPENHTFSPSALQYHNNELTKIDTKFMGKQ